MKARICLILPLVMIALPLVGCQPIAIESIPLTGVSTTQWEETCSVEQAAIAARQALESIGLEGSGAPKTRTVTTRDPKTGRTTTKQVPIAGKGSVSLESDSLSATVKAKSVAGTEYNIRMVLLQSDLCRITMTAINSKEAQDILDLHSRFIKQKISGALRQELEIVTEPGPYPEAIVFDRTVDEVFRAIQDWCGEMGFSKAAGRPGDLFYRDFACSTALGIRFTFKMRLIDTNKTKLEISVQGYKGKEEFPMILKSLEKALDGIGKRQVIAEAPKTPKPAPPKPASPKTNDQSKE